MAQLRYLCRVRHSRQDASRDVTAAVEAELRQIADEADSVLVEGVQDAALPDGGEAAAQGDALDWEILVTCDEGHENVFTREMASHAVQQADGETAEVVGRPPTVEDRLVAELAAEQAPSKQTAVLTTAARVVFANLVVLASVLTGFGLVSGFDLDPWWLSIVVVFLVVGSLVASVLAQVPLLARVRSLGNIAELRRPHARNLWWRAGWAIASLALFAFALIAVGFASAWSARDDEGEAPAIRADWTEDGSEGTLRFEVTALSLGSGRTLNATVIGTRRLPEQADDARVTGTEATEDVRLFQETSGADSSGEVTISGELARLVGFASLEVRAQVREDDHVVDTETLEVIVEDAALGESTNRKPAEELAEKYGPILVLMEGEPCAKNRRDRADPYEPEPVGIYAGLAQLRRTDDESATPVLAIDDLASFAAEGSRVYLDIPGLTPRDDNACALYRNLYLPLAGEYEDVTYATVERMRDGHFRLTYRFFYVFDDWFNRHEGDWEHIVLDFTSRAGCVFKLLDELVDRECDPTQTRYAAHGKLSDPRSWSAVERRDGAHPVVYVGTGSHASYLTPGKKYFGPWADWRPRAPDDPTSGAPPGRLVKPTVEVVNCAAPPPWWSFYGNWGELVPKAHWSGPALSPRCEI